MSDGKLNSKDLDHIAKLTRIELTEKEKKVFLPQLKSVIEYFDILNRVDTKDIEPTFRVNKQENVFHKDVIKSSLTVKESTSQASRVKNNYFVVTATIKK